MTRTKFLCLFVVNLLFTAKLVQSVCLPECGGFTGPGYSTADPYDCTQYYVCADANTPSASPIPCPTGTAFDPIAMTCTGALPCVPQCGFCHLTCDVGVTDIIADPFDCSVSYICSPSGPVFTETCPSHIPYFDSFNGVCTDNADVCCLPSCNPYCEVLDGRFVPDPKDCARYYACTASPFPAFECPAGEFFDIAYGICSSSASCVILCAQP